MILAFNYNKNELVDLVLETFGYFKGRNKLVKHLRMDNAGQNRAVSKLYKKQDCTVEFTPPGTPKLNNMEGHRFVVKRKIAKTLTKYGIKEQGKNK